MAREWRPVAPLRAALDADLDLLDWRDVSPDDWVRVVPESLEEARVRCKQNRTDEGDLSIRELIVDRKLVPDADVLYPHIGPELVCSERFIETLSGLGVRDVSAMPIENVSAHRGRGRALYRVAIGGQSVPLAPGQLSLGDDPLPPVRFDATRASNELIRRSGPLGRFRNWAAFFVRGGVVRAFHERHPDAPALLLQRVDFDGVPAAVAPGSPLSWQRDRDPDPALSLAELWEQIQTNRSSHTLPPPVDEDALRHAFATLGISLESPLAELLGLSNAPVLFGGRLAFFPIGDVGAAARRALQFEADDLERENSASSLASSGLRPPPDTWLFARSHDGDIFWGIDREHRVFGFGRGSPELGGYRYGSGLPLAAWLADFLADLASN